MTNPSSTSIPKQLIQQKISNWWKDDRRNWCAYCGIAIKWNGEKSAGTASRDHVVPKAHKGRHITIPCCVSCNEAKAQKSLPEFMVSAYFNKVREKSQRNHWSLRDLWLVTALAAIEQARSLEQMPPVKAKSG